MTDQKRLQLATKVRTFSTGVEFNLVETSRHLFAEGLHAMNGMWLRVFRLRDSHGRESAAVRVETGLHFMEGFPAYEAAGIGMASCGQFPPGKKTVYFWKAAVRGGEKQHVQTRKFQALEEFVGDRIEFIWKTE